MLMYNISMGIVSREKLKGFTIIEVMLFLALSGFLLAGILAGTGSSIANQRYKDAVQDAVDALRDAYSFVSDTQVQLRESGKGVCGGLTSTQFDSSNISQSYNSGRGRTQCVVYGAIVSINGDMIQTTTLIGEDYADALKESKYAGLSTMADLDILKTLNANNLAVQCSKNAADCKISTVDVPSTTNLKWGTSFVNPVNDQGELTTFQKTLLIIRSPRNGSIRTFVKDGLIMDGTDPVDYRNYSGDNGIAYSSETLDRVGVYGSIKKDEFSPKEVKICVNNDGAETFANHRRMIRIVKNAHSQTGIELVDMDADEESCD